MTLRLRVFAGPNGSGKSTIEDLIASKYNLGYFINPDEIEKEIKYFNRVYFFDNSGDECTEIVSYHDEKLNLSIKEEDVPDWLYNYLINKL